jgi:dihydrodipicolinate synthase/N-acetylneuraminate lyase
LKLLAAITTPFRTDGEVDVEAFAAHARWLRSQGLDGVFVGGTTGEGVLLTDEEVEALVTAAAGGESGRVIAQVGRVSTRATVALARRALAAGADGVAAYVPWFYPIAEEQAREHFLALLEAAGDAPAFIYNIPPRTVNDLPAGVVGELARAGFAGMKDSTGDFGRHEEYVAATRGVEFELYTGTEPLIVQSMQAGSTGSINGLSNVRPELFAALRTALGSSDDGEVARLHGEISALKAEVKSEPSTVGAIKRRLRERLAAEGIDYPAAPRPPFN